jgi:hypothetical protein
VGQYVYHVTQKLEIFALATSHYPRGEMKKFGTEWKGRSEKKRESIQSFGTEKKHNAAARVNEERGR